MVNVFVVLPKLEEAKTIKNILVRSGFQVTGICTTGAQVISQTDGLHDGVVISGYKLGDMLYDELKEFLPSGFELLLLASQRILAEVYGEGVICLPMPLSPRYMERASFACPCRSDSMILSIPSA